MRTCPSNESFPSNSLPRPNSVCTSPALTDTVFSWLRPDKPVRSSCLSLSLPNSAILSLPRSLSAADEPHQALEVFVAVELEFQRALSAGTFAQPHPGSRAALQVFHQRP